VDPEGFEDLGGRLVLGAQAFQEKAARWVQRVTSEQPQRKWLTRGVPFEVIVRVVEKKRKTSWPEICDRHGDWGRDLALYLARQRSGRTLREIGDALGGLEYKTTGKAIQRFAASLVQDSFRRNTVPECLRELSNVET
jgi:chromosomal replication initiation ATPase DnaA